MNLDDFNRYAESMEKKSKRLTFIDTELADIIRRNGSFGNLVRLQQQQQSSLQRQYSDLQPLNAWFGF